MSRKASEIRHDPYVRCYPGRGVVVWGQFCFSPWMARRLARKLLDAAHRLDPQHTDVEPWKKDKRA